MPKGKTSRPYNRKEKKALAVKKNARSHTDDTTLRNEKEKGRDRRTGAQLNRNGLTRTSRMQRSLFSTDGKGKRMQRPSKKK
jgi:hypothetical protein